MSFIQVCMKGVWLQRDSEPLKTTVTSLFIAHKPSFHFSECGVKDFSYMRKVTCCFQCLHLENLWFRSSLNKIWLFMLILIFMFIMSYNNILLSHNSSEMTLFVHQVHINLCMPCLFPPLSVSINRILDFSFFFCRKNFKTSNKLNLANKSERSKFHEVRPLAQQVTLLVKKYSLSSCSTLSITKRKRTTKKRPNEIRQKMRGTSNTEKTSDWCSV